MPTTSLIPHTHALSQLYKYILAQYLVSIFYEFVHKNKFILLQRRNEARDQYALSFLSYSYTRKQGSPFFDDKFPIAIQFVTQHSLLLL